MVDQSEHEKVWGRLSSYMDGEVAPGEREGIERHLVECSPCGAFLAELRAVAGLVKKSAMGQLCGDAEFVKRMHEQVDALRRRGLERFAWGLSAVAACLAIAATLQLVRPLNNGPTTAVVPAAWEGAAVQLNTTSVDDNATASSNNGDLAMTEWMVADLSQGNRAQ